MFVTEQIVYPLNYDAFLGIFSAGADAPLLLWTFIAGKTALLAITVILMREALRGVRLTRARSARLSSAA